MKNIIVIILAVISYYSVNAQNRKFPELPSAGITYNSICYAGGQTLYIAGDRGTFLKSTNGGNSFFRLNQITTKNLYSVSFINPDKGVIVGDSSLVLRTTNGGESWQIPGGVDASTLFSVCFSDSTTVYTCGVKQGCLPPGAQYPCGIILKSTDAGLTWTRSYWGWTMASLESIFFHSPKAGYSVGGIFTRYDSTTSQWTAPYYLNPGDDTPGVHFPDDTTGYIVGYNGNIWKTIDNGSNWIHIEPGGAAYPSYRAVWFTSTMVGYISGVNLLSNDKILLKTSDGGSSWTNLTPGTNQYLLSIVFINPDTGFAVGTNETILRTTDAGLTWNNVTVGTAEIKESSARLKIYPVPSAGIITVKCPLVASDGVLTVSSISGVELIRKTVNGSRLQVDISLLSPGLYFIKLLSGDQVLTGKFIRN